MREYDDASLNVEAATLSNPKPNYVLAFHKDNKQIGALDFNGAVMTFTGDADESALVFIQALNNAFAGRLKEEYERGRIDALADHGISGSKL